MARILLVDDDRGLIFLMSEYLISNGFEVKLACSAAQARLHLERSHFDAVVSDFSMPGESGLDLLDYVLSRFPVFPFIMITGSTKSSIKHEAIKRGCSGYLVKPFEFSDLVRTLDKIMNF